VEKVEKAKQRRKRRRRKRRRREYLQSIVSYPLGEYSTHLDELWNRS